MQVATGEKVGQGVEFRRQFGAYYYSLKWPYLIRLVNCRGIGWAANAFDAPGAANK